MTFEMYDVKNFELKKNFKITKKIIQTQVYLECIFIVASM